MKEMNVLGIETSTRVGTLAIVSGTQERGEELISENLRHAGDFENVLERLFQKTGLEVSDLDAISVGLGPGSFTGIRVGLAIAKGLSFALGKPLWGVGTLDVLAHQYRFPGERFCPIIAGEASEIYGAVYERKGNSLKKTVPEFNVTAELLLKKIGGGDVFILGPGLEKVCPILTRLFQPSSIHNEIVFPTASGVGILSQDVKWRLEGEKVVPRYIKMLPIKILNSV